MSGYPTISSLYAVVQTLSFFLKFVQRCLYIKFVRSCNGVTTVNIINQESWTYDNNGYVLTHIILDTIAPTFNSATVNGNTLVMYFTDASSLNTITTPTTAFSVSSGGVNNSVTGVSVDATLKKVSLTLNTPVTVGQNITLSYTDPTSNNDVNAIQDLAGNDASSIFNQLVTNNTFIPLSPVGNLTVIETSGEYTLLIDSVGVYFSQATNSTSTYAIRDIGGGVFGQAGLL
jgi:uncharacterized repeat protein (TIGR02059 family)